MNLDIFTHNNTPEWERRQGGAIVIRSGYLVLRVLRVRSAESGNSLAALGWTRFRALRRTPRTRTNLDIFTHNNTPALPVKGRCCNMG